MISVSESFLNGNVTRVPHGEMPLMEEPFIRVAVDLIGPWSPVSEEGNRYVLTIVDYATRYLKLYHWIRSRQNALQKHYWVCSVGIPKASLESQFISDLCEVCR